MWFKLSQIILRNKLPILIGIGLLTVFFGYFAITSLKLDNKYGNMLPKKSPAQSTYLKFKEMFGEDGGTLVIAVQSDQLYTEENFLKWRELSSRIQGFPGVLQVINESDLVQIYNNTEEGKFEAHRIFEDTTFQSKSIDEIKKQLRSIPIYDKILFNKATNVSLMMVSIDEDYLSDQKKSNLVLDIEDLAIQYEPYFGKMHFAGLPHIRVVIGKRVVNEMYIFIGLAILVTSLLLYLFFRSLRVVLFCNIVVFTAVIWSLGSIGLFGFNLSILMALIPPLMIVIGIPNCIFLLTKFHREVKDHGNKTKALSRVIQKVGNATFLTNLTTALGFSTFIFTNSEKLIEFGTIASLNILMVFLLSICIIPIVFSIAPTPKNKHLKHLEKNYIKAVIEKLVYLSDFRRPLVYSVAIIIVALAIFGMTKIEATGNLTSDLPANDPILKDIEFIQENFGGAIPFEIIIDYKEDGRKFSNNLLNKIEQVQELLTKDTLFSKSISMVDFMKTINMAYYGNDPEKYQLIARKDLRRLGNYVQKYQDDVFKTSRIHRYNDSLQAGNTRYIDSLVRNYPDLFKNNSDLNQSSFIEDSIIQELYRNKTANKIIQKLISTEYPKFNFAFEMKELVDTTNTTMRIRLQVLDIGSYEMADKVQALSKEIDSILNPLRTNTEFYFERFKAGNTAYLDSIFHLTPSYRNNLTHAIAGDDDELRYNFDMDPDLIWSYISDDDFIGFLRSAIDREYFEFFITGTSVVAAEGTQYLVKNLLTSLIIAVFIIAILMAFLFQSWKMVLISLVPNFIPLLVTAGIMGFFSIPIKPSTILVFSIAFGISVDDTIHFLAKYRQELKVRQYDLRSCVLNALRETGLSMFYTSIVLFFGFSMFTLSQFGGTKALGLLVSLTLLVAMLTNLAVLPSLLLTLENRIATKAFREPFITIYDEHEDIDLEHLQIDPKTKLDHSANPNANKPNESN